MQKGRTSSALPCCIAACWRSGRSPALPYPPSRRCEYIIVSTLPEGDISTLQMRGHFYFALTGLLRFFFTLRSINTKFLGNLEIFNSGNYPKIIPNLPRLLPPSCLDPKDPCPSKWWSDALMYFQLFAWPSLIMPVRMGKKELS